MTTKKLKSVARFGARYGLGVKSRVLDIEQKQKQKFNCPQCGFLKVKRKARGIFECKKCGARFTGGAFIPETLTGGIIKKMVSQKSFVPSMKELIEVTEKTKHYHVETPVVEETEIHKKRKKEGEQE